MAQVGNCIRDAHDLLHAEGIQCTLEWNEGGHFKDPYLRTAKAFALNGIVWIFEDRKDNNSVFMVFGSSLSMIAVASWMAYYFSRYVMIFVAVEVCILVFVWFLKPILQKMLK